MTPNQFSADQPNDNFTSSTCISTYSFTTSVQINIICKELSLSSSPSLISPTLYFTGVMVKDDNELIVA